MAAKLCAFWLVVLVISPFTAPFATCDLAHLIRLTGRSGPFQREIVAAKHDTNTAVLPPRVVAGRPKLVARVGQVERIDPGSSVGAGLATNTITSNQQQEALRTVLRL